MFKIGDKVYSEEFGYGEVIEYRHGYQTPVIVHFPAMFDPNNAMLGDVSFFETGQYIPATNTKKDIRKVPWYGFDWGSSRDTVEYGIGIACSFVIGVTVGAVIW